MIDGLVKEEETSASRFGTSSPIAQMSDGPQSTATAPAGFDAHDNARAIVKLFQCSQCSYPLREAMNLPCGNTFCRPCLPPLYKREHITYPLLEGRSEGFVCPFEGCNLEHSLADCGIDVTLNKIGYVLKGFIASYRAETSDVTLLLEERLHWPRVVDSSIDIMPRSRVLHGGRIVATYLLADMGELDYHSGVAYTPVDKNNAEAGRALDTAVLENLREAIRAELECQVCYQIMLDPLTTSCGHTFCRRCFSRAMDHSHHCPMCRRPLLPAHNQQAEPSNKRISHLIETLFPDLLAARRLLAAQEDVFDDEANLPIFPCTLAYPGMPTFLHIFEPRYRLMIRRCIENGSRKFGMVTYKSPQELRLLPPGAPHWQDFGTVLLVENVHMMADGRSLLETKGLYKFRIIETSMLDGYLTGRVQRVDDVSVPEEELIEAQETRMPAQPEDDELMRMQRSSTQSLLQFGLTFIRRAQERSARWLHQRVLAAYGQPPSDPATFPYWLASVLPITEAEKYSLLPATSVRGRLKIAAEWIHRLEQARW
jgi:Lon protease-like protein